MSLLSPRSESATERPFIIMVLVAVALTVWQHHAWHQDSMSVPEFLAYKLVGPLEAGFSAGFGRLHDFGLALVAAPRLVEENRRLRAERDALEAERIMAVEARLQLKAFREKLGFELDRPFDRVAARVTSRSSGTGSRWVRIRAAGGKTLEVGNAVREAKGLVGRVVEADGTAGRVVLLVDPEHAVRGKNLRTGDEGMVHAAPSGTGRGNRLRMEKMRQGAQLAVGDVIVTSELGETYPGGIPIGFVEEVRGSPSSASNLVAYIEPFVAFDRLDYVYVLRAGER